MKDDMAAGVNLGMTGMAYNKKMFDEKGWAPPTSWMDFADPQVQGQGGVPVDGRVDLRAARLPDVQPHPGRHRKERRARLQAWASTIGPNVLEYIPSSAKISEMVQTGEAAIFPLTPTAWRR